MEKGDGDIEGARTVGKYLYIQGSLCLHRFEYMQQI